MKLPELEDVMIPAKSFQGIILKFFDLQLCSDTSAYEPLKLLWERDLGVTISFCRLDQDMQWGLSKMYFSFHTWSKMSNS